MRMAFMCWMLFSSIRLVWLSQTDRLYNICQQTATKSCDLQFDMQLLYVRIF
jgi:hypothetical protein